MTDATVYAVIPVFNRLALTRNCIRLLLAQTYGAIRIVVADGGSSDGTPKAIRNEFPAVRVLTSPRELWWAGAMNMAIEHVLALSSSADDFLLMMNNDTEFPLDYVEVLVRVAREQEAAVGALTVDSQDPKTILDAGEFIDWENYAFPVKTHIAPGERFFDGVDVLPGRGSLVPLHMIRRAGNINARRFPHYIADYEFFARIKRAGYRLGVSYETALKSDASVTGLAAKAGRRPTLVEGLRLKLSRRSMDNVFDHYRFIDAAAPTHLRRHVKLHFVARLLHQALVRMRLMPVVILATGTLRLLRWLVRPPVAVSAQQLSAVGLSESMMIQKGWIASYSTEEGLQHYFRRRPDIASFGGKARQTYGFALASGRRIPRQIVVKLTLYRLYCAIFPLQRVTSEECDRFGLVPEQLVADGIIRPDKIGGAYIFSVHEAKVRSHGAATAALYDHVMKAKRSAKAECAE